MVQEKESTMEKTGFEYVQEAKKKDVVEDAVGMETVLDPAHRECSHCDNASATHHCHDCCGALCHECDRPNARVGARLRRGFMSQVTLSRTGTCHERVLADM